MRQLVAAAESEQDGTLYLTAAFIGLRFGELAALRWSDVDWQRDLIHVRRGPRPRTDRGAEVGQGPFSADGARGGPGPRPVGPPVAMDWGGRLRLRQPDRQLRRLLGHGEDLQEGAEEGRPAIDQVPRPASFIRDPRSPGIPALGHAGLDGPPRHPDDECATSTTSRRPTPRNGSGACWTERTWPQTRHQAPQVSGHRRGRTCLIVVGCRRL